MMALRFELRRIATACLVLAACWAALHGRASAQQPISIVVAYTAGGTTDTIARVIAAGLQDRVGRAVIVENKPGATGQIGSRYVSKAAPDGTTLQIATQTTHAVAPSLYSNIGYDPMADFTPIILVAWSPLVLVTNPAFPVSSVKELVDYLKARPGNVNYATGGRGDGSHMAALFFAKLADVKPVAVPFQGEGPALPQVLGNHIPYMFLSAPTAASLISGNQLRGIAVTSATRSSILPDLPTVREQGLPQYEMVNWWGIFGPKGMSPDLAKKINGEITDVLADPAVRAKLKGLGFELSGSTPDQFRKYLGEEITKWAEVIRSQGLTAE